MMRSARMEDHWFDADGNPAGGVSCGTGFTISWQNGPLGRHKAGCESEGCRGPDGPAPPGCTLRAPNGAFVEGILEAVAARLSFYQASEFACEANAKALQHIASALAILNERTKDREKRGVEGVNEA